MVVAEIYFFPSSFPVYGSLQYRSGLSAHSLVYSPFNYRFWSLSKVCCAPVLSPDNATSKSRLVQGKDAGGVWSFSIRVSPPFLPGLSMSPFQICPPSPVLSLFLILPLFLLIATVAPNPRLANPSLRGKFFFFSCPSPFPLRSGIFFLSALSSFHLVGPSITAIVFGSRSLRLLPARTRDLLLAFVGPNCSSSFRLLRIPMSRIPIFSSYTATLSVPQPIYPALFLASEATHF